MPVPAPQIPLTAETYWLEYDAGTWELYTRRGSKGRTRHTEHCCSDFAEARRHARWHFRISSRHIRGLRDRFSIVGDSPEGLQCLHTPLLVVTVAD